MKILTAKYTNGTIQFSVKNILAKNPGIRKIANK